MPVPTNAPSPSVPLNLDDWARQIDYLKAYDQLALLKTCAARIAWLDCWSWWFMVFALIAAVVAIAKELFASKADADASRALAGGGAILNAITALMGALGGLEKVWLGLFGAAFALSWSAASMSDGTCGNGAIDKVSSKPAAAATPAPTVPR